MMEGFASMYACIANIAEEGSANAIRISTSEIKHKVEYLDISVLGYQ